MDFFQTTFAKRIYSKRGAPDEYVELFRHVNYCIGQFLMAYKRCFSKDPVMDTNSIDSSDTELLKRAFSASLIFLLNQKSIARVVYSPQNEIKEYENLFEYVEKQMNIANIKGIDANIGQPL